MKKNIYIIAALFGLFFATTSCEDMLETESNRQIFDPVLDQKTDSMYYTLGILTGVQQAIDQNVLINEMRGDLTAVNQYTSADIRALANFSATTGNKYDSAYVYYRIINNCNYYIAHRDTALRTGSRTVAVPEYVQAKAIRAWAYIQLAKNYGSVPFFTEPLTNISEANQVHERKDIKGICAALAPDLAAHSGTPVPNYNLVGQNYVDIGRTNAGSQKYVDMRNVMFPVDIVLGDLYLESGDYTNAAKSYFEYLRSNRKSAYWYQVIQGNDRRAYSSVLPQSKQNELPGDINFTYTSKDSYNLVTANWSGIFAQSMPNDVITYVPMAVNKTRGQVTELPRLFGYNYYTTSFSSVTSGEGDASVTSTTILDLSDVFLQDREIDPSQAYLDLCDSQEFYYVPLNTTASSSTVKTLPLGDLRRYETLSNWTFNDSTFAVNVKYETGNINIYRVTSVYLRLAEAINRMGYPDAAFAILKDGLGLEVSQDSIYMRPETQQMLRTTIPFFSDENLPIFESNFGIHAYGSGYTEGVFSPYQFDAEVAKKIATLNGQFGLGIEPVVVANGTDEDGNEWQEYGYTLEDQINAVEDLICDEYALELGFEGTRFGDLCRLARHKNEAGLYGSNFGGRWLAKKLEAKKAVVDLSQEQNWYLPFQ